MTFATRMQASSALLGEYLEYSLLDPLESSPYALRPFSSKVDMLQRVNDGQPSARHRIGAKIAQKLHVVGAAANQEPANSNRVSLTHRQPHLRCTFVATLASSASSTRVPPTHGRPLVSPSNCQIDIGTKGKLAWLQLCAAGHRIRRERMLPSCMPWTASGAGSRFAMDACISCDLFARCESGHSTRWLRLYGLTVKAVS